MANADGSVIFSCDLDSTKAQKKLSKLRDEISELNSKLEKETGNKMNLEKQLDAASQAAKATEERVKMLRKEVERLNDREWIQKQGFTQNEYQTQVLDRRAAAEAELKQQEELLHTQTKEVKTLSAAYEETTANIDSMTARLDKPLFAFHSARVRSLLQHLSSVERVSLCLKSTARPVRHSARASSDSRGWRLPFYRRQNTGCDQ